MFRNVSMPITAAKTRLGRAVNRKGQDAGGLKIDCPSAGIAHIGAPHGLGASQKRLSSQRHRVSKFGIRLANTYYRATEKGRCQLEMRDASGGVELRVSTFYE